MTEYIYWVRNDRVSAHLKSLTLTLGFSRGAYQARTLAAMIKKVGFLLRELGIPDLTSFCTITGGAALPGK